MGQALQRVWTRRGALAWALRPVSLLYGALAALRRTLYRSGLLRSEAASVPVVVVGNVVAGGAGKTPLVVAVVEHLQARGLRPGVVSRGYGRTDGRCREVQPGSSAVEVGDEPLLIARACAAPVVVARRRIDAVRALIAAHPGTNVIVCDDGLQHYALQRDIELCVFDERGTGNGLLLPAGPLREPWPRGVDFVLCSGDPPGIAGFRVDRRLAGWAVRADGSRTPLTALAGQPLTALAGIARPQAFFSMLQAVGLELAHALPLPDHHPFDAAPPLPAAEGGTLLCTEKDAVKLWRWRPDAWAVPLAVSIEPAFWPAFDARLDAKLSSRHGSQTA